MNYLLQGFGVFLGVIAGTVVTILVQLYLQHLSETQQTRNLKFELGLNIQKIESWLEELKLYRNAVNGESLHTCFGYFDMSRIVSVTAYAMLQSGLLYKKLTSDQMGQLLVIFSEFSAHGEQFINNQFSFFRQEFERCRGENKITEWISGMKPEVIKYVDFWERKFRDHQSALRKIVESLP